MSHALRLAGLLVLLVPMAVGCTTACCGTFDYAPPLLEAQSVCGPCDRFGSVLSGPATLVYGEEHFHEGTLHPVPTLATEEPTLQPASTLR